MILVTGASGQLGGAVLKALAAATPTAPIRALYRTQQDAASCPAGVTPVVADFAEPASLPAALHGIDTLYLVCAPLQNLAELESNVIDAALATGVRHIVLNSALGAADYPLSFPSWHRIVETKLRASGIAFTILRPNGFMQNILAFNAPSIRAQGAFYDAMGEARTSFIDANDIAAVVARVLLNPAPYAGHTYELNGPEAVTNTELAARISAVAGRQVQYVVIPEDAQRQAMLGFGLEPWRVEALLDLQRYYTEAGGGGEVTTVLTDLLGRAPMHLNDFLAANKAAFAAA